MISTDFNSRDANAPMAVRFLTYLADGEPKRWPVRVRVWAPVRCAMGYACDFAIDGLPDGPIRSSAYGVDSMQAVVLLQASIRAHLIPYRERLGQYGEAGYLGFPYSIVSVTPAEEARLETLVESEAEAYFTRQRTEFEKRLEHRLEQFDDTDRFDPSVASTQTLVARMRTVAIRIRDYVARGDVDTAANISWQFTALQTALEQRDDYRAIVFGLMDDSEVGLRFKAAMSLLPDPVAIETLERVRNEGTEPWSSHAARRLKSDAESELRAQAEAKRPKPWDDVADGTRSSNSGMMQPVHPGEILAGEFIEAAGLTSDSLATALGLPASQIEEVIAGNARVTGDLALRLGRFFDMSAEIWINLQGRFDLESACDLNGSEIARTVKRFSAGSP